MTKGEDGGMKTTRLTLAALATTALLGVSACGSDDGPPAEDEAVSTSAGLATLMLGAIGMQGYASATRWCRPCVKSRNG